MALPFVKFLSLVFTALALVPYGAHLFSLPNKIGMTEAQYFIAQSIYQGWGLLSLILIPAMLFNVVLAYLLRSDRPAFYLAAAACVFMAATLAVFFAFTYPANVATQNWTVSPAHWVELRRQWEYSHAVNACFNFLALCLVAAATVVSRR
jgi:phosphoglycerol transferase MdoB-like AlkP superfamily enzyme